MLVQCSSTHITNPLIVIYSYLSNPFPTKPCISIHPLPPSSPPPMASTASDCHSLPSSAAAPGSAFLDDHPLFLPSSSSTFLDDQAASFHLPSGSFTATTAQDPPVPPSGLPSPPPSAARKPPRKRPRASRRPPTTVLTTDASNFRAMVQEFTGFPAPPPFVAGPHHLRPGGVIFGAGPSDAATAAPAPFQLLRPSPLKLPASHAFSSQLHH